MAKKLDWHGMGDSTPSSSPKQNPKDQPVHDGGRSLDWKGLGDSTPASDIPADRKGR